MSLSVILRLRSPGAKTKVYVLFNFVWVLCRVLFCLVFSGNCLHDYYFPFSLWNFIKFRKLFLGPLHFCPVFMLIYEQFCPFLWTFISRPLNSSSHPGAMVSIDLLFFPFSHSPNSLLPRVLIYQSSFLSCHMLIIPFEFLVLDLKFPFPLNYFSGVNLHAHFYRFGARFKFGSSVVGGSSVYWLPFGSLNLFFFAFLRHITLNVGFCCSSSASSSWSPSPGSGLWLLPEMKHISCVLCVRHGVWVIFCAFIAHTSCGRWLVNEMFLVHLKFIRNYTILLVIRGN